MITEIYYFSGTGNSLFVAKELQKRILDSKIIPMVSLMNNKVIETKGKIIGFVFPVHALTIPIVVKQFIKKLELAEAQYIFAIATRWGTAFHGFTKIDQILKRNKKQLNAHFILDMCNNESRHINFIIPNESYISEIEKAVIEKIDNIEKIINNSRISREKDYNQTIKSASNPFFSYLIEKLVIHGMDFADFIGGVNYWYHNEKCNGCGICEKVCLSKKIKIVDKKPTWNKNTLCYMCFACLNYCPKVSVQIKDIPGVKSYTIKNGRYPHPYASVKDISLQKEN